MTTTFATDNCRSILSGCTFRSLAWQEMQAALPTDGALAEDVRALPAVYLEAIHAPKPARDLQDHLDRFTRQIAIWRAAPLMLAARRGDRLVALVDSALTQFCIAWRLIDDIQDIDNDRATGQDNCVRLVLDTPAAASWDALRGAASQTRPEHPDDALTNAVEIILRCAREALRQAHSAAVEAGLHGWADEMHGVQGF
jgi:hypothetical protein